MSTTHELRYVINIFDKLLSVGIEDGWDKNKEEVACLELIASRLKELSGLVALESIDLKKSIPHPRDIPSNGAWL